MTDQRESIDPRIQEMVQRIVDLAHPEQIILFGSRATGTARPDSDVDFLVITTLQKPRRRLEGDLYVALAGSELAKDIVVLTPREVERFRDVPGTIVKPALESGLVVYRRAA